jgi:hypothetical protein
MNDKAASTVSFRVNVANRVYYQEVRKYPDIQARVPAPFEGGGAGMY